MSDFVGRYFATSDHLIGYTDTGTLVAGVFVILGAAGMAFMLGVSEYWLVYHTSSLTLVISGVFKVSKAYVGSDVCMLYKGVLLTLHKCFTVC